ncbi:MAG: EthD domain-containing protein [Sedimentisphaerales bacterium]|nr:EthD domain-containing protein [Sedimentisphaerales bacterium]
MFKIIARIAKKPGMSNEEFEKYWLEVHGPLTLKIPGIRGYKQNRLLVGPLGLESYREHLHKGGNNEDLNLQEEGFGIVEIYFDDFEALNCFQEWLHTNDGQVYQDVEENFQDRSKIEIFGVFEELNMM